jgi:glycosyltransferase involved in cell wall biosynthesis
MKIALVHPWLTNLGGAERLLLELHNLYPDAPIYTSVFDKSAMPEFAKLDIRTTWLQKLPFWRYEQQVWSALRPFAFRSLDLSEFDVVISVDTAEAKNVQVHGDAIHICYCNSPIRYYWSHYREYLADPGFGRANWLIRIIMPPLVWWLRRIDYKAAQKVDYFVANSSEIEKRVRQFYHRSSRVINPPVSVHRFVPPHNSSHKRSGFVIASRQTPYKRVDLAIKACNELGLPLTVIGNGTEHEKLKAMAGPTIRMLGHTDDATLIRELQRAEAFIFPAEEDFGIVPIEAMAAGCPVIAYAKGGVVDWMKPGVTGEVFKEQNITSLKKVLKDFDSQAYDAKELIAHAEGFNGERFKREIDAFISSIRSPGQ